MISSFSKYTHLICVLLIINLIVLSACQSGETQNQVSSLPEQSIPTEDATNADSIVFPIVGDWFYKNNGEELKYINEVYSFTKPSLVNGKMMGEVTITIVWMESVNVLNYEIVSDKQLIISDPQGNIPTYELNYIYDSENQILKISDQDYLIEYTRAAANVSKVVN